MANKKEQQEQENYGQLYAEPNANMRMKDLEEKQNMSRERLLLMGQNLIEIKEETSEKLLELKKDLETLKHEIERIKSFLEIISEEFSKFAKKEDLEILAKQAKMFQPFKFKK
jgi:hypothetical protein|tara:strand:+ start:676 stop:1014 length:339 start_codon:yes stop_codon:yes gene_type:complete